MGKKRTPVDVRLAALASRQHGVVSSRQLHAAGLGDSAVAKRCRAGRLHRLHRGVYSIGHTGLSAEGRWMAAVLALGVGAALSHRSAAVLWGLLPFRDGLIDVAVPGRGGRRQQAGIRVHRPVSLSAGEVTIRNRIPTTTPARTIADLRTTARPEEYRRARRQADVLGLAATDVDAPDRTRSELERAFLDLCRRHCLPMPDVNVRISSFLVDFHWPGAGLIVETDGYRFHRGRAAFEDDRRRDLRLHGLGYEVLRLSHHQVLAEATQVAGVLRAALRRRGALSRSDGTGRRPGA